MSDLECGVEHIGNGQRYGTTQDMIQEINKLRAENDLLKSQLKTEPCPIGCKPVQEVNCHICGDTGAITEADRQTLADAFGRHG
ncbi:hypothetical protein [Pseudovibrio sp. Ad37]|uniref:hypothetical protein n=1 Tax=Pseudovibrio sp. Ad37 TaxID=989422 RepID=UPI0007AE5DDD|nr:hypothetical protein [Pseudovibrio sp. Ad37]KZL24236.1 hypothetical protein PsAD37_02807 [Pseudovibrio sp. Ad37]